jgi:hypothetical protein
MTENDYDDTTLFCRDCGDDFVWTAGERLYYQQNSLQQPKRCKACRQARRSERDMEAADRHAAR